MIHLPMAQSKAEKSGGWISRWGGEGQKITSSEGLLDVDFKVEGSWLHVTKDMPFA